MKRGTVKATAEALLKASDSAGQAADQPLAFQLDDAGERLALAIYRLDELRRVDARYDLGALHAFLLEYLPRLVAHKLLTPELVLRSVELRHVATQLHMMAYKILELEGRRPKVLDIAGAIAAERDDLPTPAAASIEVMAGRFLLPRCAASPLPPSCPRGHRPQNIERRPEQIQGDVLDCITCDACGVDYVLLAGGWSEVSKPKEVTG